jgi:hypothetical protein
MIDAFNENNELKGSFGFNGRRPQYWGQGLLHHLHRWGTGRYVIADAPTRIEPDF